MSDVRLQKPEDVVAREREWALLVDFLTDPSPAMRLGIVSGRRRHGKSYLLNALTEAAGGLYITAVREEGRLPALRRFSNTIASYASLPPDAVNFTDWEEVLTSAIDVTARRADVPLLVIDEFPYLLRHSPELPGLLQKLYDEDQRSNSLGGRVILCGSAVSVMHDLLAGAKALRGRAVVDLRLAPFDFRVSRRFWGIDDLNVALQVDAVLGSAPGYLPIARRPSPDDDFATWLTSTVLEPGRAVYSRTETEHLLREEPRITDSTLYYDTLAAIADGAHTQAKVGAALGRERNAVAHPLKVLESAGHVRRDHDVLRPRNPVITLTDPIIRFNQLITLPMVTAIENGAAAEVWDLSRPTFNAKILGPHFEDLVRAWAGSAQALAAVTGPLGVVGSGQVPDRGIRKSHQLDLVGLPLAQRPGTGAKDIAVIGEAKATAGRRGLSDLERLDHIRGLLGREGHGVDHTVLALFSLYGFQADLERAAASRRDVLLVDLPMLYGH